MLRSTLSALVATALVAGAAEAQLRSIDQSIYGMD